MNVTKIFMGNRTLSLSGIWMILLTPKDNFIEKAIVSLSYAVTACTFHMWLSLSHSHTTIRIQPTISGDVCADSIFKPASAYVLINIPYVKMFSGVWLMSIELIPLKKKQYKIESIIHILRKKEWVEKIKIPIIISRKTNDNIYYSPKLNI